MHLTLEQKLTIAEEVSNNIDLPNVEEDTEAALFLALVKIGDDLQYKLIEKISETIASLIPDSLTKSLESPVVGIAKDLALKPTLDRIVNVAKKHDILPLVPASIEAVYIDYIASLILGKVYIGESL